MGLGREGDQLAFVTKSFRNGSKQFLCENGIRILKRNDGLNFVRNLDGKVISYFSGEANSGCCVWKKNKIGKYQWDGGSIAKMLNFTRISGVELLQGKNGVLSRAVKTFKNGYKEIVFEDGQEIYKMPSGK